jgi:hypothetical protein
VEKIVDREAKRSNSGAFSLLAKPRRILIERISYLFSYANLDAEEPLAGPDGILVHNRQAGSFPQSVMKKN